jgi:hypothetical protein
MKNNFIFGLIFSLVILFRIMNYFNAQRIPKIHFHKRKPKTDIASITKFNSTKNAFQFKSTAIP